MKNSIVLYLATLLVILLTFACKKEEVDNPCDGAVMTKAEFYFKENLSDTSFEADTVFSDNYVTFEARRPYKSVSWKLGSDPRTFSAPTFNLSFPTFLGTIDINFTGIGTPNTTCFPSDSGVYKGTKKLTVVAQVEKPHVTLSPMIGRYRGAYRQSPQDTFTVRIEYFDSSKYDVTMTGNKNFYWISNMPKGYVDKTSSPALAYPELRQGMSPEMGYKCLRFGDLGNELKGQGFATLNNDSLIIYYNHVHTGRKMFIGRRI